MTTHPYRAHKFAERGCAGEDDYSCYFAADNFDVGNGVAKNERKAQIYHKLACEFGYDESYTG